MTLHSPQALRPAGDCLAFLLAGGQGSRLYELTRAEAKPALPFAGTGRIVDFVMENLAAAGIAPVIVATQYRPRTLVQHLRLFWAPRLGGAIMLRDGPAVTGRAEGYRGTADAVAASIAEIDRHAPQDILVVAGDHVYDMDFTALIAAHRRAGRAATVAATAVPLSEAPGFGILSARADGQVTGFVEKPAVPVPMVGDPTRALASMGIYVFDWRWLRAALLAEGRRPESRHDFGHDILPRAQGEGELGVRIMPAGAYWRDVGTLDAYRLAQLDFLRGPAPTRRPRSWPPAQHGFPVAGAEAACTGSVLLPGARAGRGCRLWNTILAPGAILPAGLVVGEDPEEDARWFRRTAEGTTLVTPEMLARRQDRRRRMFSSTQAAR